MCEWTKREVDVCVNEEVRREKKGGGERREREGWFVWCLVSP